MEVYGGGHNRRLIGVRIRRFSVEDLHNRLFLRYKVITEDPDRDLIQIPMIHCAFNCRHLMSRIEACFGRTLRDKNSHKFGHFGYEKQISLYILQ